MGVCFNKARTLYTQNLQYQTSTFFKLKSSPPYIQQIFCQLSPPAHLQSKEISIQTRKSWISECILPGQHPRSVYEKQCQDLCFSLSDSSSILLTLFDGHGPNGSQVVQFCRNSTQTYFSSFKAQFRNSPQKLLKSICQCCNRDLTSSWSGINSSSSGCTAIFIYINHYQIVSASVGDSRSIIGTSDPNKLQYNYFQQDQSKLIYRNNIQVCGLDKEIWPIQLTKDQKPEDPKQLLRIKQSGGRVDKYMNSEGVKIGPYRVWQVDSNTPGLAMARSIGDMIGKSVGVISTPITSRYLITVQDQFLVLASDGVWDVMNNTEVVRFVSTYRKRCQRNVSAFEFDTVEAQNTCIAHLLCEEARNRWVDVARKQDVTIDDISCIVLEFN